MPDTGGYPIAEVGIDATGPCELEWVTIRHIPDCIFQRVPGSAWREAWVNGASQFNNWPHAFSLVQNEGTGSVSTGARDWIDYEVKADLTLSLCDRGGLAVRVQGMRRFYALLLCRDGFLRLIRVLDGEIVLAELACAWEFDQTHTFWLRADHDKIIGGVGDLVVEATDSQLTGGGIALVVTQGRIGTDQITVIL